MKYADLLASLNQGQSGVHWELARALRALISRTVGTATGTSATLNALQGKVTTGALATAADAAQAVTITNDQVAAGDIVLASVANGTNSGGEPVVSTVTPAAGSVVIRVENAGASAFNGTLVVSFVVVKAA